jgi:hypothetical protein
MTEVKWIEKTKTNAEVIGWIVWGFVIGALVAVAATMVLS